MSLIKAILIPLALSFTSVAHATQEIELSLGESIQIGRTHVICGEIDHSRQTAVSLTCASEDYYGKCIYFNEDTLSGRYCATAQVCGKVDYYGKCVYFNTKATCGDRPCTKSKHCGQQDYYGKCNFFNESVSCE